MSDADAVPKFNIERPSDFPLDIDVVGRPRKFIDDFISDIEGSKVYRSMGVQVDSVYGLFGVPGVGKTLAVNAIYNTINQPLLEEMVKNNKKDIKPEDLKLALMKYDIGRYGTAYINMGSRIVQRFFDVAFSISNSGIPVLIEMDEADALLGSRTSGIQSHSEDRKTLETIMKNLQTAHDTEDVYVVLMSNLPEACDAASLRAGRIDKKITFELPNLEERTAAYEHFIYTINNEAGYSVVRNAKPKILGEMSKGFNYADIKSTIDGAVKTRAREIIADRSNKIIPAGYVTQKRLEQEVNSHNLSFHPKEKVIGF
jgi:ATP-dependent 26S proteasome regulatory subunit